MSRETMPPPVREDSAGLRIGATLQADHAQRDAALAGLAFGTEPGASRVGLSLSKHLAFLPLDALDLDLSDPEQRAFGDYELTRKLGQGGMGVVYQARQISLDRQVAVKLLAAGPWASFDFIERFRREAQSAARMQHPNIVAIYEIGTFEELNFFSMRLVHGPSLAAVLEGSGPMAPKVAAKLLRTIAEALDYAHRMGVLHLDLKPGNVLIDERGEPQIADFGLARRLDESLSAVSEEVSGTPSYMAPEQAVVQGHKLSPATDIYGLGAILYECLSGRPPFVGATAQQTLERVVTTAPESLRERPRAVPADLDAICMKCLAKDPAERYRSARELADDLGRYSDDRPVSVRPLNAAQRVAFWVRREPRLATLAAMLLVSLLLGLVATSLQWRRAQQNAATANALLWEGRREAALRLEESGRGFEAAPKLLMNIAEREAEHGVAQVPVERSHLGVLLSQSVSLIDSILVADANPLAAEVSPDGRLLALALNDLSVRWYDTRTLSEQGRIDLGAQPTSEGFAKVPALLRFVENQRLRVTLEWGGHQISPNDIDSFLIDLKREALVVPPPEFADFSDAMFSPDGDYALLRNQSAGMQLWQVEPWRPLSALTVPVRKAIVQPWILGRGARFAAYTLHAEQVIEFYDPREPSRSLPITLPAHGGITAWAESANGNWLALGDNDGRVFVVDMRTYGTRVLPTPKGQDISWLAFSEDDAWLAACGLDGAIHAFDVASGDPLASGVLRESFELRRVAISHSQRLLIAAGVGQTGLWRVPEPSPQAMEARRVHGSPTRETLAGQFAIGWSLNTGLLATAGVEGQVRLWRMPTTSLLPAHSSRLLAGSLQFDGKRIVDVAFNQLRIVAPDGSAASRWLQLAGAPGYAELVAGGSLLVVTVAQRLSVYDSTTLQARYSPLELPGTPQNLTVSADGRRAVMSFGHAGSGGFEEHLEVYDLVDGKRLAAAGVAVGPLRQLELSADASRLLATGPRTGATQVFATEDLQPLASYAHDASAPVIWAAFSPKAHTLLLAQRADDPRAQDDALIEWDYRAGTEATQLLPNLGAIGVAVSAHGAYVIGANYDRSDPGGDNDLIPERMARSPATVAFAVSPDRRLLARGHSSEVQLLDADTLAPVGPPLSVDTSRGDVLARLAFAPDSRQLLGRGVQGSWYLWQVAADMRTVTQIGQDLALLHAPDGRDQPRRALAPSERNRLRHHDNGDWPQRAARPAPAVARWVHGAPIPARAASTSPWLLDLTQVYNIAPDAFLNDRGNIVATQRFLGSGVQRLDGIDYDIRGSTQLINALGKRVTSTYTAERVSGIEVPPQPVAAFHVLMLAGHRTGESAERIYAQLRLHYRDGSSALLPLRTLREVPGWTENDGPVPFGWAYGEFLRTVGVVDLIMISNPRLANPYPSRIVTTLDLEAGDGTWNMPVFLAVTAEPVIVGASSVKVDQATDADVAN